MKEKSFRGFLDRFEGKSAVVLVGENEQAEMILPSEFLPEDATEGSVLKISIDYLVDDTLQARSSVEKLIDRLSGDDHQ